jgi:hypothetical protein
LRAESDGKEPESLQEFFGMRQRGWLSTRQRGWLSMRQRGWLGGHGRSSLIIGVTRARERW